MEITWLELRLAWNNSIPLSFPMSSVDMEGNASLYVGPAILKKSILFNITHLQLLRGMGFS